jgi:DNA primase
LVKIPIITSFVSFKELKNFLTMQLPELKTRLQISTVLQRYNLKPDKNGMLKCPFHADKTPSLKIYTDTNTYNCFGCGANGDAIQFIESFEKLNKHQAIIKAKELCGQITEIPTQTTNRAGTRNTTKNSSFKQSCPG